MDILKARKRAREEKAAKTETGAELESAVEAESPKPEGSAVKPEVEKSPKKTKKKASSRHLGGIPGFLPARFSCPPNAGGPSRTCGDGIRGRKGGFSFPPSLLVCKNAHYMHTAPEATEGRDFRRARKRPYPLGIFAAAAAAAGGGTY